MKDDKDGGGQQDGLAPDDRGAEKTETYIFFVGKQRFETEQRFLTAGQIKARVAGTEPGDKLSLEGKGDEPDRLLQDEEEIDLKKERGPLRFTIVPSASFGA